MQMPKAPRRQRLFFFFHRLRAKAAEVKKKESKVGTRELEMEGKDLKKNYDVIDYINVYRFLRKN